MRFSQLWAFIFPAALSNSFKDHETHPKLTMPAGVAYDGSVWVTAAGSVGLGKSRFCLCSISYKYNKQELTTYCDCCSGGERWISSWRRPSHRQASTQRSK